MTLDGPHLELLKQFVDACKLNTDILNYPKLAFFKDWLVSDLKATIPGVTDKKEPKKAGGRSYAQAAGGQGEKVEPKVEEQDESDEEEEEEPLPELDIDMEGVVEEDTDALQEMGDDAKEPTEEENDEVDVFRSKGMEAFNKGEYEEAVNYFTSGILLDNNKTVLFVKRALAFIHMEKPNAAARDAQKALWINQDSAAAYKALGKAQKLLGKWDEATRNFETAQRLDYDGNIAELIREIKPKATKIREHKMATERRLKAIEERKRQKRLKKAQEAQKKANAEQEARKTDFSFDGKFPEFTNMKGMPTNFDEIINNFTKGSRGASAGASSGGPNASPTVPEEPPVSEIPSDDLD